MTKKNKETLKRAVQRSIKEVKKVSKLLNVSPEEAINLLLGESENKFPEKEKIAEQGEKDYPLEDCIRPDDPFPPRDDEKVLPDAGNILSKDAEKKALFEANPLYKGRERLFNYGILWTKESFGFITSILLTLREYCNLDFTIDDLKVFRPTFKGADPEKALLYRGKPFLPALCVPIGTQFSYIHFSAPWIADVPGPRPPKLYLKFEGDGTVELSVDPEYLKNKAVLKEYIRLSGYVRKLCLMAKEEIHKKG